MPLGDDEHVRVFNTNTFECERSLHDEEWGQVTALCWIHLDTPIDAKATLLCVGSGRGIVSLFPVCKENKVHLPANLL